MNRKVIISSLREEPMILLFSELAAAIDYGVDGSSAIDSSEWKRVLRAVYFCGRRWYEEICK